MTDNESIETMPHLLALPHEILHNVLQSVDPQDLSRISQTCRTLNSFLKDNQPLHKEIYIQHLDYTPKSKKHAEPIWTEEIRKLLRLESILLDDDSDKKLPHIEFVAQTVAGLLQTSAPPPSDPKCTKRSRTILFLSDFFNDEQNRKVFFCNSELFGRARYVDTISSSLPDMPTRQASAKLHCLYGVPIESTGKRRSQKTYPYAVSKVYDLRNYTQRTMWGPFMDDGSGNVDWERVEAIMVTLGYNLRRFEDKTFWSLNEIWDTPFAEAVPNSYISRSLPFADSLIEQPKSDLDLQDPYDVCGTYTRIVCFLDYSDLFSYNFILPQPPDEPRAPYEASEVVRMIIMELRVTKVEPPGPSDHPDFPVVYFRGESHPRGVSWDPNAHSNIKGTVRTTKEGEIRWTTFSIYEGEARWRSEGIQVGGIRSQRGIFGNWFDKDYDIRGPAGPTAFWKISDAIEDDPNRDLDDPE